MVSSILSASLLLASASAYNLAGRVSKTSATCDARRSTNIVARLGFLQDTRATEMAGAESTTYGEVFGNGYGMGGMSGFSGRVVPLNRGNGGMYGGYGSSMYGRSIYNQGMMGGMYGRSMYGGMNNGMYGRSMYNQGMMGGMYNRGYGMSGMSTHDYYGRGPGSYRQGYGMTQGYGMSGYGSMYSQGMYGGMYNRGGYGMMNRGMYGGMGGYGMNYGMQNRGYGMGMMNRGYGGYGMGMYGGMGGYGMSNRGMFSGGSYGGI